MIFSPFSSSARLKLKESENICQNNGKHRFSGSGLNKKNASSSVDETGSFERVLRLSNPAVCSRCPVPGWPKTVNPFFRSGAFFRSWHLLWRISVRKYSCGSSGRLRHFRSSVRPADWYRGFSSWIPEGCEMRYTRRLEDRQSLKIRSA